MLRSWLVKLFRKDLPDLNDPKHRLLKALLENKDHYDINKDGEVTLNSKGIKAGVEKYCKKDTKPVDK